MKIALITAGAAGMYCGSCINDNTLATALRQAGHDAILIPTYTPIRTDEPDASISRVFLGGINVYLQQKFPLFRHTPRWLDWLWDFPALLRWVSRFAVSTSAKDLGELTVSMLKGIHGNQQKELEILAAWLGDTFQPDVIHLSNLLLSGLIEPIRKRCSARIVCSLQGDDIFLESLPAGFREEAMGLILENSSKVDVIVAASTNYADRMSGYLGIAREKIQVVLPGITSLESPLTKANTPARNTLGYFARICPEKGFHLLVDAWIDLRKRNPGNKVILKVSGWLGKNNEAYFKTQLEKIRAAGLSGDFFKVDCPDAQSKAAFFESIDLLSVPSPYLEPKGLYILEAWSHGVPVLQPDHGSFPELLEKAGGGGWLFRPNDLNQLTVKLEELLANHDTLKKQGEIGRGSVQGYFHCRRMASDYLRNYGV